MPRFDSFDLCARASGVMRRVAKIKFAHDGSLYVFFPGFAKTEGILSLARLRGGQAGPTQLDLTVNGRVTANLVKYSHHVDGHAHFSQDGKVFTTIRRMSVPLREQRGHLFTIQVQNVDSFPKPRKLKPETLTLELQEPVRALKITAWRNHVSELRVHGGILGHGLPTAMQMSDGIVRMGLMVAPPEGAVFDDFLLFLAVEETPALSADNDPQLIFMGGFDPLSIALKQSADTEFLAFAYPCSDFEQLKKRIGCIDISRTSNPK